MYSNVGKGSVHLFVLLQTDNYPVSQGEDVDLHSYSGCLESLLKTKKNSLNKAHDFNICALFPYKDVVYPALVKSELYYFYYGN